MKIKKRNKSFKLIIKKNYKEYIKVNINNINYKYNIYIIICLYYYIKFIYQKKLK